MLTQEEIIQIAHEADESVKAEVSYELARMMRESFIDWARGFDRVFFMAAYSAVNGAWDDLKKDLRRGKITPEQANQIIDKLLEYRIIVQCQANWQRAQIAGIERNL